MGSGVFRWVERLVGRNYQCAKALYKFKQRRRMRRHKGPPIVIFQMGKVGSKSVRVSLENLEDLDMPVYHAHFLTKPRIRETEAKRKKHFRTSRYPYLRRPWLNEFLSQAFEGNTSGANWKIITLTREPIGRNLSTFFENLQVKKVGDEQYEIKSDYYDIDKPITFSVHDTERMTQLFMEKINHDSPLVFFDNELKEVFGVDVYAREFPKEKGYDIYEGEKCDVLLIRLESLNDCHKQAMKEFLGLEDFELTDTNVGADKEYALLYKSLKDAICLPEEYLEKFYASKYVRHFYTESEIEKFRSKWERKPVA